MQEFQHLILINLLLIFPVHFSPDARAPICGKKCTLIFIFAIIIFLYRKQITKLNRDAFPRNFGTPSLKNKIIMQRKNMIVTLSEFTGKVFQEVS